MDMMLDERMIGMSRRFGGPSVPGLVRLDRAVLYIKQRVASLIREIEVRDTKGLGDSVYSVHSLVRQMASLLAMSGNEAIAEKLFLSTRNLSTRTPRKEGVDTLRTLLTEIDAVPQTRDGEDVEAMRERLELLEQQVGGEGEAAPHPSDTSKENTVFVIMPFKPEFNDVWKGGIVRAAKAESFTPIRVDKPINEHYGRHCRECRAMPFGNR